MLSPLLFNIYICDMFLKGFECDITDYADNKMSYLSGCNLGTAFKNNRKLQQPFFFHFFEEDFIK